MLESSKGETRMRRIHAVALGVLSATIVLAVAVPAIGANGDDKGLSKHDRALLAEARAEGKSSVIVLVAAKGGAANEAIRQLEGLGATIQYRDAALGYIRASIAIDKVSEAARLSAVLALDVDETIEVPDPRPEGVLGIIGQPVPGAATPRVNPYMPTGDTGAAQFVNANPTWDGRNVTIGIVDTGISLDHPSLADDEYRSSPRSSTGLPARIRSSRTIRPGSTWLRRSAGGPSCSSGVTYTAPHAGTYRIGLFNERDPRLGGEVGNDVNRDGNPAG